MGKLSKNVEVLVGRPLTGEEMQSLTIFQHNNEIDDSDPLIVVLAYMARSHMILEQFPEQLAREVKETIELHKNVLRDQSNVIAKDLVTSIALGLEQSNKYRKFDFFSHLITFMAGALLTAVLGLIVLYILRH